MRWVCSHLFTVIWLVLCAAGLFATYVVKVIA